MEGFFAEGFLRAAVLAGFVALIVALIIYDDGPPGRG